MAPFSNPPAIEAPADEVLVATTSEYREAQELVDRLSDAGFAVDRLSIVWEGLRQVEHVTGRLTTWRAAGVGALAGAWFGGLFGWLFAWFSVEGFAVFVAYLVVGAIAGAIWRGVGHAMQRGRRDFATATFVTAHEYQLWCDADLVDEAQRILGTHSTRAMDPEPSNG